MEARIVMTSNEGAKPNTISVETEETSAIVRTLTVEVDASHVNEAFDKAYAQLSKSANVKGFRKGKAPRSMLEKLYGSSVSEEVRSLVINATLPEALDQASVAPVAEPAVDAKPPEPGTNYSYTARVEVMPEIALGDVTGLKAESLPVEVDDEEIEKQLESIRERAGTWEDGDADTLAEQGDRVKLDYEGRIGGELFEGGAAQGASLELGSGQFIPGFEEQLVGSKAGDEIDVTVSFPEQYQSEDLAGKEAVFACKVHAVEKRNLPALDDELAKNFGGFDTLDELRERMKADSVKNKEHQSKASLRRTVLSSLLERTPFEVPGGIVDRMLGQKLQQFYKQYAQQLPPEFLQQQMSTFQEQWRPEVEREVREALLLQAVAKQQELSADDSEVEAKLEEIAKEQGMDVDRLRKMYGDHDPSESIHGQLLDEKALDFLLAGAKVEEGTA
jgi:trigger factor